MYSHMGTFIDLSGKRFGRLLVLGRVGTRNGNALFECQCDCGQMCKVASYNLRAGNTQSCGCYGKEVRTAASLAARGADGRTKTPTYRSWHSMIYRTWPGVNGSEEYRRRGITVCERWKVFDNFLADMGERPAGTTLDRYPDKNGNYEPGNCRWATPTQQQNNMSSNVVIEFDGERRTIAEWARHTGIGWSTINNRIKRGWPLNRALTEKPGPYVLRSK